MKSRKPRPLSKTTRAWLERCATVGIVQGGRSLQAAQARAILAALEHAHETGHAAGVKAGAAAQHQKEALSVWARMEGVSPPSRQAPTRKRRKP